MKNKDLKIYLAAPRGFCAGVDRAIEIVKKSINKFGSPVYVRHEIVHNKHVVEKLKEISPKPVAVGFGISSPEHVNKVSQWGADGVIVGSAFVKRIASCNEKEVVNQLGDFCDPSPWLSPQRPVCIVPRRVVDRKSVV